MLAQYGLPIQKKIQILAVQRAARFIKMIMLTPLKYSHATGITMAYTLEERRWAMKATMVFKILHNIVSIYLLITTSPPSLIQELEDTTKD